MIQDSLKIPELVIDAQFSLGKFMAQDAALDFIMLEHPRHGKLFFFMSKEALATLARALSNSWGRGRCSDHASTRFYGQNY